MKFFIDTGIVEDIKKAAETGLVDGVTTNPSLAAKSGMKYEDLLLRICEVIDGPVSGQVLALEAPKMISEGKALSKLHPNIVVKVPLIAEGIKAVKALSSEGIRTNVTLCFSSVQALVAAKAGASYISPFIGRLDDIGQTGMDLIRDIRMIYDQYGYETEILGASIRTVDHVLECARTGADVVTLPPKIFYQLVDHPLTDKGLAQFLADYKAAL